MRIPTRRTALLGVLVCGALTVASLAAGAQARSGVSGSAGVDDSAPLWSPNGKQIAFSSQNTSTGQWTAYVINAAGGGQRLLSPGKFSYRDVAWSPSGRQIGFSALAGGQQITSGHIDVMAATSSQPVAVTSGSGFYDELFGWSPSGASIAFDRITGGVAAIYTMNPNGTNLHELTPSPGDDDYWAAWSPNSAEIAFDRTADDASAGGEIWVMNADGSAQRQLTHNSADNFGSAWSPNGKQILFQSNRSGRSYQLYLMSSTGGVQRKLTSNVGGAGEASWSPNGSQIAYEGVAKGNEQIFVMNANGSDPHDLSNDGYTNSDPSWSPNGKQIAFLSTRNSGVAIYVMNANGSGVRQLT
jgi:TolB protein